MYVFVKNLVFFFHFIVVETKIVLHFMDVLQENGGDDRWNRGMYLSLCVCIEVMFGERRVPIHFIICIIKDNTTFENMRGKTVMCNCEV